MQFLVKSECWPFGTMLELLLYSSHSRMAVHEMRLHPEPFALIKAGTKTVEMRLYDEKRRLMNIGDHIEFSLRPNGVDQLRAEIVSLDVFNSFKEAFNNYPPAQYGSEHSDEWQLMYKYYSPQEEVRYGVVGVRIKKI